MTGQTPATNGCPGWVHTPWDFENPLPLELREAGYQTKLTGKIHSLPLRNHLGFEDVEQHEALYNFDGDDYTQWLEGQSGGQFDELTHGLGRNSWDPRPSHLPEHLHPTVWTTDRALEFLDERDQTRPFFLNVSYVRPHTPLDPPQAYWDMYADRDLPDPYMGDWVDDVYGEKIPDQPAADAWLADLSPTIEHRARAGYYGLITQIDHQIKRIIDSLRVAGELENTFILFCSDHGEMLGDHHLWRKTYAYEGSARVPMVMRFHDSFEGERKQFIDRPVGLEDIMPTLLEIAGESVPDTVEGRSLLDLVEDPERTDWREWYHGENSPGSYDPENGAQYLVDGDTKFIWNPVTDDQLLFDLDEDPGETTDLSTASEHQATLKEAKQFLIERLDGREEGYVSGGELATVPPGEVEEIGDSDDSS